MKNKKYTFEDIKKELNKIKDEDIGLYNGCMHYINIGEKDIDNTKGTEEYNLRLNKLYDIINRNIDERNYYKLISEISNFNFTINMIPKLECDIDYAIYVGIDRYSLTFDSQNDLEKFRDKFLNVLFDNEDWYVNHSFNKYIKSCKNYIAQIRIQLENLKEVEDKKILPFIKYYLENFNLEDEVKLIMNRHCDYRWFNIKEFLVDLSGVINYLKNIYEQSNKFNVNGVLKLKNIDEEGIFAETRIKLHSRYLVKLITKCKQLECFDNADADKYKSEPNYEKLKVGILALKKMIDNDVVLWGNKINIDFTNLDNSLYIYAIYHTLLLQEKIQDKLKEKRHYDYYISSHDTDYTNDVIESIIVNFLFDFL